MIVLWFCVYKYSNTWHVLMCVCFQWFGWSYPLLESERPSSFRSVSVIVARGLFACRLCCYRAKQPISLHPTLRTTNHLSSPTASLYLRANSMTHVAFFSTRLFFCNKVSLFWNVNLGREFTNIFWIIRIESHPSLCCTVGLKWTPRFWDQYHCAGACRDSVSKNTASGGVAVYVVFISLSLSHEHCSALLHWMLFRVRDGLNLFPR